MQQQLLHPPSSLARQGGTAAAGELLHQALGSALDTPAAMTGRAIYPGTGRTVMGETPLRSTRAAGPSHTISST